ncbi:hypothetical protein MMC07_000966 [Pseudocyphellaria aurata]|nr:hypothetical protein [Pseudocyphellaria aurata]
MARNDGAWRSRSNLGAAKHLKILSFRREAVNPYPIHFAKLIGTHTWPNRTSFHNGQPSNLSSIMEVECETKSDQIIGLLAIPFRKAKNEDIAEALVLLVDTRQAVPDFCKASSPRTRATLASTKTPTKKVKS